MSQQRQRIRASRRAIISGLAISGLTLAGAVIGAAPGAHAAGESVSVTLSDTNSSIGSAALTAEPSVAFSAGAGSNPAININEGRSYQTMVGFGATFTDASAYLMYNNLSSSTRAAVMANLFGSSGSNSIGLSYLRQPTTSTDYDYHVGTSPAVLRTYDDNNDQADPTLANFSIAGDMAYIIPVLQQAVADNPALKVQLNGWTAPAWMKTNNALTAQNSSTGDAGSLLPQYDGAWAQYIVKSIQAYRAQGIPVWSTTVANEPTVSRNYPSMLMPPEQNAEIVRDYLEPDLAAAGLTTRILAGDDSPFSTNYTTSVIDSDKAVSSELPGISSHGYFNSNPDYLTDMHNDYPNKEVLQTELAAGCAVQPIKTAMMATRNWSETAVTWNVALNPQDGPYYDGTDSDSTCTALVTINPATQSAAYTTNYYQEGQVSKFVQPGAVRIDSNQLDSANAANPTTFDGVDDVAFKNPNGSKALVAWNSDTASHTFSVNWGNEHFDYTLKAGEVATFTWSGTPVGDPAGWGNSTNSADTGTAFAGGTETGTWNISNASTLTQTGEGDAFQSIYDGYADHSDLTVSAAMRPISTDNASTYPKYGIYACYANENEYVQAMIDPGTSSRAPVLVTNVVEPSSQSPDPNAGFQNSTLPNSYVAGGTNTVTATKTGNTFTFAVNGTTVPSATRTAYVGSDCQAGLVTQDYETAYTNVSVTDPLRWGGSQLGAAKTGDWETAGPDSVTNTTTSGTSAIFRGYVQGTNTVSAAVQAVGTGVGSDPRYGIYAAYANASNYVQALIDPGKGTFVTDAVVGGVDQGATSTALPSGFSATAFHTIAASRSGNAFTCTLDGASEPGVTAAVGAAQIGTLSQGYAANFRHIAVGTDAPFSFDPNLAYHLWNRNSLTQLSLLTGSTTDQNPAIIYSAVQAPDQQWKIVAQPGGSYKIENVKALQQSPSVVGLLSTQNRGTANGTDASIYHDISAPDQYWSIIPAADGSNYLELTNNNTGKALSVYNRGTANSTPAIIYDYLGASQGATDQDWTIVPVHDVG